MDDSAQRARARLPLEVVQPEGFEAKVLGGRLAVPENPDDPAGRSIDLNLLVVPALAQMPQPDPLVHLDGGPGVPATQAAGFYAAEFPAYRARRDVLLLDQRGTGGSHPLHCDLYGPAGGAARQLGEMYPADRV